MNKFIIEVVEETPGHIQDFLIGQPNHNTILDYFRSEIIAAMPSLITKALEKYKAVKTVKLEKPTTH